MKTSLNRALRTCDWYDMRLGEMLTEVAASPYYERFILDVAAAVQRFWTRMPRHMRDGRTPPPKPYRSARYRSRKGDSK